MSTSGLRLAPARPTDFEIVLAKGGAAVPAAGMQAIPDQLAARLPEGTIRLNSRVAEAGASMRASSSNVASGLCG